MPRNTITNTVAPDVANSDGSVTRVITMTTTIIYQNTEYQALLKQQQTKAASDAASVTVMQAILAQASANLAASQSASSSPSPVPAG
jgi:hypothetical protein